MKVCTIIRNPIQERPTMGRFLIDNNFHAYSLEDQVRPYGQYVQHKTAIPYGMYEIVINFSNRFKRPMPLIVNMQYARNPLLFGARDIGICGIRIHGLNTAEQTDGCPGIGAHEDIANFKIWDCKQVFDSFFADLENSLKMHKVLLEVVKG